MKTIRDFKSFIGAFSNYENPQTLHPKWMFRGQSNSNWTLMPSLARIAKGRLNKMQAEQLERENANIFSTIATMELPLENTIALTLSGFKEKERAIDFLGWSVVMQHYGAPTRILDWTKSPWVALYFACSDLSDVDGAIWIADFDKVTRFANYERANRDVVDFLHSRNTNPRIEAQQGRFTTCQTNPLADHQDLLEMSVAVEKIEIPKDLKREFMISLTQMNISAKTLFPGIEGLGKSVTEYSLLWDSASRIS